MDKKQIDEIIQILKKFIESEEFSYIGQLNQFIKNQDEISKKIEKIKNNPEELDIESFFNDISTAIQSEIPEEELSYFYAEVYSIGRGLDEVFGIVGEKKEIAQSIWNKRIEERTEEKDDEEKLKISEEYGNIDIREMVLLHLSDLKKVELLKGEGTYRREFEKKLIESIKNPQLKLEAIRISEELSGIDKVNLILNEEESFKIQAIKILKSSYEKETVLQSIKDPKKKIELINQIMPNEEKLKKQCIDEIEDPKERLEIGLKELIEDAYKAELIMKIENPKERLETALKELKDDSWKSKFIMEIQDPKERLEIALKELQVDVYKLEFIMEIKEPVERIKVALEALQTTVQKKRVIDKTYIAEGEIIGILKQFEDRDRLFIAITLHDPKIRKEALAMFYGIEYIDIASTLDDKDKLELLENDREKENVILVRGIKTPEIMEEAINKLKLGSKQKECLKRLYQKNNDVMQGIDFRILDDHYIETLGEDKINLMACYPGITQGVVELSDKGYKCFCKIIGMTTENESKEWISRVSILGSIHYKYTELIDSIESIDDIDVEKLLKIMLCSPNNWVKIKSAEDIKNYEMVKKEKCDQIINNDNKSSDEKKNAVFMKIFGIDIKVVNNFIEKFGQDIDNIDEPDLKNLIYSLKSIMQLDDPEILRTIYEQCEEVSLISPKEIEARLKKAYGKKFNEGLYTPKEGDVVEENKLPEELRKLGVKVYDAGIDFKMLITSIGAYVHNSPQNFQEDWNRPALKSQFFCTSYIRNDMIGTCPIPHVCYGFSNMADDSLMASGFGDLSSTGYSIEIRTLHREIYYTPEMQINNTKPYYNEMCFQRFQKGERKQPDYIVAIKKDGKIINSTEIAQAVKDWEWKIPVVIVDEEKCLESEKSKINEMMTQYETTQDVELAKKIMQKVRNNRMTDRRFCEELQERLKKIETSIENNTNSIEVLEENYQTVTPQERKEGMSELERVYQQIKGIRENKEGENVER